jgi:hypothetical protein
MLALQTKQSGGKLLHHSDLRGGSVSRGSIAQQAKRDENDLQEVGCGHVDWIGLAQDGDKWRRLVSALMNLRGP